MLTFPSTFPSLISFCLSLCLFSTAARTVQKSRFSNDGVYQTRLGKQSLFEKKSWNTASRMAGEHLVSSMAYLVNRHGKSLTGVLITPQIVLSPIDDQFDLNGTVYIGNQTGKFGTVIPVSCIIRHPSYIPNYISRFYYNVMYIELARPAPLTARPVKVLSDPTFPRPGSFVRRVGYMLFNSTDKSKSGHHVLHQVDLPVFGSSNCHYLCPTSKIFKESVEYRVFCSVHTKHSCSFW